MQLENKFMVIK